jgi:aspartyl-tRNA(Asn)/glutamyl-tRNA(Gln) amidotransferase subunit C
MSLDKATVQRIATLARIEVADADLAPLAQELSAILGWIEQLQEVDTTSVAPMTGGTDAPLPWRKDVINEGGQAEKVVANAPDPQGLFFTVPKVVE